AVVPTASGAGRGRVRFACRPVNHGVMLEHKRQLVRVKVTVEVTLESEHNFYTGFLQNLSTGGLFVATHDLHSTGAELEVQFTLPDQPDPCEAVARVRWVR